MNAQKHDMTVATEPVGEFHRCCHAIEGYLQKAEQARLDLLLQYDAKRLHAWRVNLRRVTATLGKLAKIHGQSIDRMIDTLKQCRDASGASRDLDILAEETLPAFAADHPSTLASPALWQNLERQRTQARNTMLDGLRESSLTTLIADFNAWVQHQQAPSDKALRHAAASAIADAHHKLSKRAEKIDGGRKALHRMRTATKKLRYTIELFQHAYPRKAVDTWLDALSELQGQLGKAHDRMTGQALGRTLLIDTGDEAFVKKLRRWSKRTAHRAAIHADTSYRHIGRLEAYWQH
ncbi:MAG TPA: CHAD domain-containing protein [Dyella sp.]|uniref:CHAD domain-containing protein n=1 Tax=Dyella sp. TaxID=1869338 RepID=UPI002F952841